MFTLFNKEGLFFRGEIMSPNGEVAKTADDVRRFSHQFEYILITGYIDEAMLRFEDIQSYQEFLD